MEVQSRRRSSKSKSTEEKAQRRSWRDDEERALLEGLKDMVSTGWKGDNGFRSGHLGVLESMMEKNFPGCGLKASPHIHSKIQVWKRNYGSLQGMMNKSGFGFNEKSCTIDVANDVWELYLKVDPNAKGMRFKPWPYYNDWCIIFGKDRATGEHGVDLEENSQKRDDPMDKETPDFEDFLFDEDHRGDYVPDMGFMPNVGEQDSEFQPSPQSNGQSSAQTKSKSSSKRKTPQDVFDSSFVDVISNFSSLADFRLGEIANRIGHEHERAANLRKALNDALKKIPTLTVENRIFVANVLVKDTEKIDYFFTLDDEDRATMADMIVKRTL